MQFQVPQFIETEDKIVGPLTLRQFIYLAVAGLLVFLSFFILQTWLWLIVVIVLGGASAALAFIQINGRPMLVFTMNAFTYLWEPHSYVYSEEVAVNVSVVSVPAVAVRPTPAIPIPLPKPAQPLPPTAEEDRPAPETVTPLSQAKPTVEAAVPAAPAPKEATAPPAASTASKPPVYRPTATAARAAERAVSAGLKDLWSKLQTTKNAIPHREKPLAGEIRDQDEIQEKYEIIRKITGEGQLAKRVDYK